MAKIAQQYCYNPYTTVNIYVYACITSWYNLPLYMPNAHNSGTTVESWPLYTKKLAEGAMSFFPSGSGRVVLCYIVIQRLDVHVLDIILHII